MTLRLVYRSYGGENLKGRPDFYSKDLALASFALAASRTPTEIVFLNDGPVPDGRLESMRALGEVVSLGNAPSGMRSSYRAAIQLAANRWGANELVYLSEDDYLYHPDAFRRLARALPHLPPTAYVALYAATPTHHNVAEFPTGYHPPRTWRPGPDVVVDGQRWTNVMSTTSTFGARSGALREDLWIFRLCMFPFRNRLLDHETCLIYQGQAPHAGMEVITGRPSEYPNTVWGRGRRYLLAPFRIAHNAAARTRRGHGHLLYAPDANLACHLESEVMNPGRDWAAIAAEVAALARRDLPSPVAALVKGSRFPTQSADPPERTP
ncbi:MAG: hypothetical protein WAR57_14360 [Candidatus Phosphoribacter sp.]